MPEITKESLWKLRREITLNSLYTDDYKNSFQFNPLMMQAFFDGWLEHIELRMKNEIPEFNDGLFFLYLHRYDTKDCLWNYYNSLPQDDVETTFVTNLTST